MRWAVYAIAVLGVARLWYAASVDFTVPGSAGDDGGRSGFAIDVARDVARELFETIAGFTDRFAVGVAASAMTVALVMRMLRKTRPTEAQRASDIAWALAAGALGALALVDFAWMLV